MTSKRILAIAKNIIRKAAEIGLDQAGYLIMSGAWPYFKKILAPVVGELEKKYPNMFLVGDERAIVDSEKAADALSADSQLQRMLEDGLSNLEHGQEQILTELNRMDQKLVGIGTSIDRVGERTKEGFNKVLQALQEPRIHQLAGKVINDSGSPLPGINLRLPVIGSTVCDDNGEFFFDLPPGLKPGDPVEFSLHHENLVTYQPPGGLWNVPRNPLTQPVKIVLLPKGDHRLLGKEGLKLLMNKMIENKTLKDTENLQKHVQALQPSIGSPTDPLEGEAKRLGFAKNELLLAVEHVTKKLQQSEDVYEVGLAALYNKHYGKAAALIEQSIEADEKKLEKLPEKYSNLGNAYVGENKLEFALQAYTKSVELAPLYSMARADIYLLIYSLQKELGRTEEAKGTMTKCLDAVGFAVSFADSEDVFFFQIHINYEKERYTDAKKVEKSVLRYGRPYLKEMGKKLHATEIELGTIDDDRMSLAMISTAKKIQQELLPISEFDLKILPKEGQGIWEVKQEFWLTINLAAE